VPVLRTWRRAQHTHSDLCPTGLVRQVLYPAFHFLRGRGHHQSQQPCRFRSTKAAGLGSCPRSIPLDTATAAPRPPSASAGLLPRRQRRVKHTGPRHGTAPSHSHAHWPSPDDTRARRTCPLLTTGRRPYTSQALQLDAAA
jgi:hypothetical protein